MIIYIVLFIISLFLEILFSTIFKELIPFFILAWLFILGLSKNSFKKKVIFTIIAGLIYDFVFTSYIFFNSIIFFSLIYFLNAINDKRYFKNSLLYIVTMFLYVFIININSIFISNIDIFNVFVIVIKSLIINVIYYTILYFLMYFINRIINK